MSFVTPSGFRDILPEEAAQREDITARVQACLAAHGYLPIETPTLENIDVLDAACNLPGIPFRFFDAEGNLLALRPDVTMQVARMCATRLHGEPGPFRFRYTQRVFREATADSSSRELMQLGAESIGESGSDADADLVSLFAESLEVSGVPEFTIALGSAAVLRDLLRAVSADGAWKDRALKAYQDSDFVELDALVYGAAGTGRSGAAPDAPDACRRALAELPHIYGKRDAIDRARRVLAPLGCDKGLDDLEAVYDRMAAQGRESMLLVDFSMMRSFNYYTGVVFEAYAPGLGEMLGSGGRYDDMLAAYDGTPRPSAGFAFYLEQVMAARTRRENPAGRPLRIAVPKGSLNADSIACLARAGLDTAGLEDPGRQLIISNPGVDYIIVRPTDAPVFVSMGAADCGICGKDSLLEAQPNVVELVDLGFGGCRFVVAQPKGATAAVDERYRKLGSIRVASKYPRITRSYYDRIGVQVDIVQLHGNIELAPLTGLAERIVDITATGRTLRENNLEIVDDVLSSTARFFANPCAFRLDGRVNALAQALKEQAEED